MGRAMSEGGVGDNVTVQNPASFRMITAIVIAPGTVRATGAINAPRQHHRPPIGSAMRSSFLKITTALLLGSPLAACSAVNRLENIGEAPKLARMDNPAGQQLVAEIPRPRPVTHDNNSLWQPGSQSFFHDPRATQIGDVITSMSRWPIPPSCRTPPRAAAPIRTTPT